MTDLVNSVNLFHTSFSSLGDLFKNRETIDISALTSFNVLLEENVELEDAREAVLTNSNNATKEFINSSNGMITAEQMKAAAINNTTVAARLGSVALNALSIAGNMIVFTLVAKGIELAAKAISDYIHRAEIAHDKTIESIENYEALKTEIKGVESQLSDLNKQINSMDSITDAEDIQNLEDEKDILEMQLAILKEKQRIASEQADKNAQESLGGLSTSEYKSETTSAGTWMGIPLEERTTFLQTTKIEEANLAIDAYNAASAEVNRLTKEQAELAETTGLTESEIDEYNKKISEQEAIMQKAREDANKLVSEVNEEAKGLNGLSDESKKLIGEVDALNTSYRGLLNTFEDTSDAQGKLSESQKDIEEYVATDIFNMENTDNTLNGLGQINEQLDNIQAAYKTLSDAMDTYNESGAITIDQFQAIIAQGDDFLDYLVDEEGNLRMDEQAMYDLAASRIYEMKCKIQANIIDSVTSIQNEKQAAEYLASTNYALADSYTEVAKSKLEAWKADALANIKTNGMTTRSINAAYNKALSDMEKVDKLAAKIKIDPISMGGGSGSGKSSSTSQFEETYDFFEDRIDNLNDAYELLETNIENVNGAVAKNNLINAQYDILTKKVSECTDALDMYKQKANEALSSIPADIVDDVVNGAVKITDFIGDGNEAVVDAIKDYNTWADKVSEVTAEIAALQEEMRQLELSKFNNIAEQFDSMFDIRGGAIDNIQKQIDLLETSGQVIGEAFYTEAIAQTEKQIDILNEKRVALANQLADSLASGRIQTGTDEWEEMVGAITEVEGSILDAKNSVEEFNNSIQELHWDNLERVGDAFDGIADELSNISDLYDDIDVASKDGTWSDEGLTQLGMAAQQYELARYEVEMYGKEIEQLKKDYAEGKYSATEYAEKLAELNSQQWDSVQAAEDAKDAMVDLNQARVDIIVEGIEEEIEAYEKLTQAKIDELEAERDLKNYRDQLADQTKAVADIEKQLAAMANDNTAATNAKRKQLEEQLAEAKKNLADTEYDHSIDEQTEALNKQLEEFTETKESEIDVLEEYIKDTETVISDSFETVKDNAETIAQQLEKTAKKHGVVISDTIIKSWKSGETAVASYGKTLTAQTSVFTANLVTVQTGIFQLQTQANVTAQSIANMFGVSADKLIDEMQKSYNSAWNVNNMMNALRQSAIQALESGYNVDSIVNSIVKIGGAADDTRTKLNLLASQLKNTGLDGEITVEYHDPLRMSSSTIASTSGNFKPVAHYASGTKNAKAGWAEVDEEGEELKFVTVGSKKYQLMNSGDQVIPHAGTENLWAWSKVDPAEFAKKIKEYRVNDIAFLAKNKMVIPNPDIMRPMLSPVLTIDNLVNVNGSINNDNLKQMQATAEKAVNNAFKRFTDEVRKAGGLI